MKVFRVVADSSCLISLAQIDKFKLLKDLFLEVYIPHAVYDEVVIKGEGEAGSDNVETAIKDGWLLKKAVEDDIAVNALTTLLGKGESEVIILFKELGLAYALIDEKTARDVASLIDVKTIGKAKGKSKRGHTLISDLISSNRLLISSSLDIFDFIIVTRRLMEE